MEVEMEALEGGASGRLLVAKVESLQRDVKFLLALIATAVVGTIVVVVLVALSSSDNASFEDPVDWGDVDDSDAVIDGGDGNMPISADLPMMNGASWESIESIAQTQTLNFYLWSPENSNPRVWIDEYLTPELGEKGITVNRIDAVYSGCDLSGMALICDVQNEVDAGMTTDGGAVDLVWINGANFANMKERDLLYGPFATLLPNSANFDFTASNIAFDAGVATEGLEFPFHNAQSIFIHNEAHVPSPPMTIPDFVQWVQDNPGRFAYSASTDFTGAAFVRTMFFHYAGDAVGSYTDLMVPFDEDLYMARAPVVWQALNELEQYLYVPEGTTDPWYPATHEEIRDLVGNETLWMDFSFGAAEASTQMNDELNPWPETMQGYVLSTGTIADSNFLAIPVNANNKEAALVAINHIATPGSMFTRSTPEVWGALQSFDPTADGIKEWDVAFDYILTHEATPTVEELAAGRLGDLSADWVSRINADWVTYVQNY